jgi:hypothetical protein
LRPHFLSLAAWAAAAAGNPAISWSGAAVLFAIGVVLIMVTVVLVSRGRGRPWGVAWGMRSRWRRGGVRAAADADVAAMQKEDETFFRADGPGHEEDDL